MKPRRTAATRPDAVLKERNPSMCLSHDTPPTPRTRIAKLNRAFGVVLALITLIGLVACGSPLASQPTPTPPALATELVLYDWPDDIPQAVLDAFTREYGVTVTYQVFQSQEAAVESMRSGQVYDVVVMSDDLVPALIADHLLAEIDYRNVPNFKNISANFLDLAYDPANKHS